MTAAPTAHDPGRDSDERRVAQARRHVIQLAHQLIDNPLDPELHARLRAWLDTEAGEALAAMDALRRRPVPELRDQVRAALTLLDSTLRGGA
nr:hypothetical protein KPHV_85070 [Kitasatospora purpeofusca]